MVTLVSLWLWIDCPKWHDSFPPPMMYLPLRWPISSLQKSTAIMASHCPLFLTETLSLLAHFGQPCSNCLALSSKWQQHTTHKLTAKTERTIKTLEQMLRIFVNYQQNDWDDLLPY